jgi:choline-sulfatase
MLNRMRAHFNYDAHFTDEKRAVALRAYYGMVTMLDKLIGDVIASLHESGFADNTRIVYAPDHGDNLGNHGMWGKSVMYEDSVAVPVIMAGKDVPAGKVVNTPVSLIDIAPTAAHATGIDASGENYPGRSLIDIANSADEDRVAFSQYHAAGSDTGQFMIRKGKWKYVAYAGDRPQLFDLDADPDETTDLWNDPSRKAVLDDLDAELRKQCDPDEVNARAFADQQRLIEANGGRDVISSTVDIPYTPAPT